MIIFLIIMMSCLARSILSDYISIETTQLGTTVTRKEDPGIQD